MGAVVPASVALPEIRRLIGKLELEAEQTDKTAALSIMEQMLAAESEEELFERQQAGAVSSKDFTLRPFRLLPEDITWKKSNQAYIEQGGFPFFTLLRVTDMATGDSVVIDSGSPSVISVLDKLLEWDDEERPIEKRAFERFRQDGGRPLQFVPKTASSGYSVILLMPVVTETKPSRSGKK